MFTIDQIKAAHSKVKSGADFPGYVKEIATLGVTEYTYAVGDGSTTYYGAENFSAASSPRYAQMTIADAGSIETLLKDLKIHQAGGSDFLTFCRQAAEAGVEKWTVNMNDMTCTYYDLAGNKMLTEAIPDA